MTLNCKRILFKIITNPNVTSSRVLFESENNTVIRIIILVY